MTNKGVVRNTKVQTPEPHANRSKDQRMWGRTPNPGISERLTVVARCSLCYSGGLIHRYTNPKVDQLASTSISQ